MEWGWAVEHETTAGLKRPVPGSRVSPSDAELGPFISLREDFCPISPPRTGNCKSDSEAEWLNAPPNPWHQGRTHTHAQKKIRLGSRWLFHELKVNLSSQRGFYTLCLMFGVMSHICYGSRKGGGSLKSQCANPAGRNLSNKLGFYSKIKRSLINETYFFY